MNPGHDSACSPHMAEGAITMHHPAVSGHVCSDESRGSSGLSPGTSCYRYTGPKPSLNKSERPLLSMSSPTRVRSRPVQPSCQRQLNSRGRVGALAAKTEQRGWPPHGGKRHGAANPAKSKGIADADARAAGGAVFSWSWRPCGSRGHGVTVARRGNGGSITLTASQLKPISTLNYSLREMKDAAINVYEWSGIEVWVIVSWGIELGVCLRAVKTARGPAIVARFNYHSIVWSRRQRHFWTLLRQSHKTQFVGLRKRLSSYTASGSVLKSNKGSLESPLSYSL